MMIKTTERHLVYSFFQKYLGQSYTEDFRGCLYIPKTKRHLPRKMDDVAIAVGYNNFTGRVCSMHTVIQMPEFMTRKVLREVFEFPFIDCNCTHVLAPVEASNEKALAFDKRLGFRELYRFIDGAEVGDLMILTMAKDDCRWIRSHHGQEFAKAA